MHVRVWTCRACGVVLDRDINAALNVAKAAGLAVSACGAQVRPGLIPASRSETGTHPKPPPTRRGQEGIPGLKDSVGKRMNHPPLGSPAFAKGQVE
ncbi:zinc ribbon domain-containing protein [Streptomyces sp. NPDC021080]|uniref:zinc ribbon domain-containing protein n=1 Tax=Streptomyces sp. NPDC021080 TaxID=3365110 RepID=UPI00379140F8